MIAHAEKEIIREGNNLKHKKIVFEIVLKLLTKSIWTPFSGTLCNLMARHVSATERFSLILHILSFV